MAFAQLDRTSRRNEIPEGSTFTSETMAPNDKIRMTHREGTYPRMASNLRIGIIA
jgi:hypothetical protein